MRLAAITIPVALVASTAFGQSDTWLKIGDGKQATLSLDPNSVRSISADIKSAWFEFKRTSPRDRIIRSLEMDRINCSDETTATVSVVNYDTAGDVVSSNTTSSLLLRWEPAPPGTLASTMVRVVCNSPDLWRK